jgi:hypothetical protein
MLTNSLFLLPSTWDLALDASQNIAVCSTPYAQAQDAACACRLWQGEAIYNTSIGLPYDTAILGNLPPSGILASWLEQASLKVPGIANAQAILQFSDYQRTITGQVQLTLTSGANVNVSI